MPLQYSGIRDEHLAVRARRAACSTSRTWGRSRSRGPTRRRCCSGCSPTTSGGCPRAALSTASCCREDGGVLDDLFTYRLAECHFLTVSNAANHERDLAWFQAHKAGFDADVVDRRDDFAMLAVQGPEARATACRLADGPLPPRFHCCQRTIAGRADAGLRDRLHRRGRGRAAARPGAGAGRLGRAARRPAPRPPGSARATRSGSRSAFTCTATT